MKRLIYLIIKSGLGLSLLLLLAAALLIFTESGRVWVAETGLSIAADRLDYRLDWQGLQSPDLNHWQLDTLVVAKEGRTLIDVTGIDLHWHPEKLFSGRLVLDALQFKKLTIGKIEETGTTSGVGASGRVIPISIRSLTIDALALPLPGEAASRELRVSGTMEVFSGTSLLMSELTVTPAAMAVYKMSTTVKLDRDGTGHLSGWYSETPEGPASMVLKLPRDEPFETSFSITMDRLEKGYRFDIADLAFVINHHNIVLQGRLQEEESVLVVEEMRIEVDETEQVLTGRLGKDGPDLQLLLTDLPLDILSGWTDLSISGVAGGRLILNANYSDLIISGNLNINTMYRETPLWIDLTGTASGKQLLLEQALIKSQDNELVKAQGVVSFDNREIDLDAVLEPVTLDQLRTFGLDIPDKLKGEVRAQTVIRGPWDRLEADIDGGFTGLYKGEVPVTLNIRGEGRPLPEEDSAQYDVNVQHFDLQVREHLVTGEGRVNLTPKPLLLEIKDARIGLAGSTHNLSGEIKGDHMALNLNLKEFPLDILSPLVEAPFTGLASGKVFLGGTLSEPLLRGNINSDFSYKKVPLHLETELNASRNWLEVSRMDLAGAEGTLTSHGLIDLAADETNLEVSVDNLSLAMLQQIDSRIPEELNGQLNADVTITGSRDLPYFAGTAEFAGGYRDIPFALSVQGQGNKDRFTIADLDVKTRDDGRVNLTGEFKDSVADFNLTSTALPLELFKLDEQDLPAGTMDAAINIKGSIEQPEVAGKLGLSLTADSDGDVTVLTAIDADVSLDADQFHVKLTLAGENARTGNIEISLPWRQYLQRTDKASYAQMPLAGTIRGEAYLQEICLLLLDIDVHDCKGRVRADLSMSNTFAAPRFDGTITLEDGYYENMVSGTSLHDVHMDVKAAGNRIEIIKGVAGDGDSGTLELEGGGSWQDTLDELDINLVLRTNNAHLLRRYDMDGTVNGVLTLTGDHKDIFLAGTLDIVPFTLALEALLQEDIPTLKIVKDENQAHRLQASRQKWQILPAINLNVELKADQQAFLRGPNLEAELQGKILIQGIYPDTTYRGNFRTVRGSVRIIGKRFILAGGEVRLENEIFSFLIPAVYDGKDLEVRAELSGTVDELQLALSSSPVYPEDEIVSRLLFNKSADNISPLQAVRLANTIAMLRSGGKPLFDPLGKIEKTLSVDRLNVEDAENGDGVMLGVGKYIHEKVYVEVETGTGSGEPWQGNIQIELLPNLNLENSINGESGFGNMELQWKKDY